MSGLPELPPLPEMPDDPLSRVIMRVGPVAQKIIYPVLGLLSAFETVQGVIALASKDIRSALVDGGAAAVIVGLAYAKHFIDTAPGVYARVQSLVFEQPYRDHVKDLASSLAGQMDATHNITQAFHLTGPKAVLFRDYLAAHLLSRQNVLPNASHMGLDPEAAREIAATVSVEMGDPARQLWYEQMPLVHGLAKEELLASAEHEADITDFPDDEHWDRRKIEIAAESIAGAYGRDVQVDLYAAFIPLALHAAETATNVPLRQRRHYRLMIEELRVIAANIQAAGHLARPERDTRIEFGVKEVIRQIGTN